MKTDRELLRCYLEQKSEAAFTQLVQRYLGLVYSTALRRVGGDAQLAEDVAQKVFSDLARKASSLTERGSLAGWLHVSAHVTSAAIVRSERRRRARENEAHLMQTTVASADESDWTHLRPVIDDAIVALKAEDREAIALRFFEQRSFAEVGAALRLTEVAARKRVDRALDKLRAVMTRRGVTSTGTALALALGAISVSSVPATLAERIANHALAASSVPAGGSVLGSVATVLVPAAALVVVGGFLIGAQRSANNTLREEVAQLAVRTNTIPALHTEIRELARFVTQADDLRRMHGELPDLRRALAAASAQSVQGAATLTVAPNGTISWGTEGVKLAEFIARLKALQTQGRAGDSRLVIRAPGADFSALAYVVDEARKAGIQQVVVESDATPNAKLGFSWF